MKQFEAWPVHFRVDHPSQGGNYGNALRLEIEIEISCKPLCHVLLVLAEGGPRSH